VGRTLVADGHAGWSRGAVEEEEEEKRRRRTVLPYILGGGDRESPIDLGDSGSGTKAQRGVS